MKIDEKICLQNDDFLGFTQIIREKLENIYNEKSKIVKQQINEFLDPETEMYTSVQNGTRSYGGYGYQYDQGVLTFLVPNELASEDVSSYLDTCVEVYGYEIEPYITDDDGSPVDLQDDTNDISDVKEVTVYFETNKVVFDNEIDYDYLYDIEDAIEDEDADEYLDEEMKVKTQIRSEDFSDVNDYDCFDCKENLLEIKKKKVIRNVDGKSTLVTKYECPPGKKFDSKLKKCVKITAKENRARSLGAKKAARARRGQAAKIAKRRARSMRMRSKRISS